MGLRLIVGLVLLCLVVLALCSLFPFVWLVCLLLVGLLGGCLVSIVFEVCFDASVTVLGKVCFLAGFICGFGFAAFFLA